MNSSKHYLLAMFPYPSGEGLHVGHVAIYTGTDVLARYWRRQGKEVLAPMGWDAFGLPAENFAIKKGVPPAETTDKNILNFRKQMDSLDLSYDWQYEINTSKPEYYKWTQWVFLQLFKQGLAYQSDAAVNWCESCQTVLANEQVVDGKCERCGNEVIQKKMRQWFLKITDYAEELLAEVEKLDWPEKIKQAQRNWIGKSTGSRLHFKVKDADATIEVFTTRADTLFGCSYVVLAPEHPLVAQITTAEQKEAVAAYVKQAAGKSELERTHLDKTKSGVFTGAMAINPINQEPVPVWVADYVVMGYGTGAIMAVPAHDERDLAFAQKYDLAIKQVIAPLYVATNHDAPREDKETVRRQTVKVIVKHWSEDSIYCLDWTKQGWHTFVIGGIEDGETPEEAAVREVKEETGYQNIRSVRLLPVQTHSNFYASHKDINRYGDEYAVYVELGGDEFIEPDEAEIANHVGQWLPRDEAMKYVDTPFSELMWQAIDKPVVYTDYGILINSGEYSNLTSIDAAPKITEAAGGKLETMWRLRDWLVSRQRYWGAPIPIIHCEKCGAVPVPEEQLPVKLPEDVDFKPTGHSPLADSASFNDGVVCPKCGAPAKREVDTMDTFVCSSWYYLRYPSATVVDAPFDPELTKKWLPVDEYVGGAEHAVLHLLYSRFVTKALRDAGHLDFGEPFLKLRTIGLILGPDHQKMSKSRGNVVNPDEIVAKYGSDALRLHELFLGPFGDEKPWKTETIKGVVRFLEAVTRLTTAAAATSDTGDADVEREAKLHRTIQKVTDDLAEYRFNTAIAALMTLVHEFGTSWTDGAKKQWLTFIELLSPLAPRTAAACWKQLGQTDNLDQRAWPTANPDLLVENIVTWTVTVNGKPRGTFTGDPQLDQAVAVEQAKTAVATHLDGKNVVREVFVPGRLVNFVLTD
jgi:leucyl-tRNA synthetase